MYSLNGASNIKRSLESETKPEPRFGKRIEIRSLEINDCNVQVMLLSNNSTAWKISSIMAVKKDTSLVKQSTRNVVSTFQRAKDRVGGGGAQNEGRYKTHYKREQGLPPLRVPEFENLTKSNSFS